MSQIPSAPQPKGSQDIWSGVRWIAFANYAARFIRAVVGVILVRLLNPEDYGLIGMALVVIGFLQVFQQLGFGQAIVQRREINASVLSGAFLLNMGFSSALALGVVLAAPWIERFYHNDEVGAVTSALGISFVISAVGLIPMAMLNREMRFDKLAIAQLGSAVAGGALSLTMALTGWGVWALVAGVLATAGVNVVISFVYYPWMPGLAFRWSELRDVFRFGGYLTAFQIVNYLARNTGDLLIGSRLGERTLGFYRVGYGLMEYPRDLITMVAARVLFPAFSRLQDDLELGRQYIRTFGISAFLTFPILTGLMVLAHPFVEVVYGEKWLPVVPVLMILAPVGMLRSVTLLVLLLYQAKARTDTAFRWECLWSGILVASFFVGSQWGLLGVAYAFAIAQAALFIPMQWVAVRTVSGLKLADVLRPLGRHIVNCALMGVTVAGFRLYFVHLGLPVAVNFAVCILIGAIVYGLLVYWMRPPELFDLLRIGNVQNKRWLPKRLQRNSG